MADVLGATTRLIKDLELALSFVDAHRSPNCQMSDAKEFLSAHIAKLRAGDIEAANAVAGYFASTSDWDDIGSEDAKNQCAIGAQVFDSVRYLRWHQERQAFNDRWLARFRKVFAFFK